ncbi:TPA: hypothetical protein ACWX1I_002791, partial [Elizabethkingia anophelis]
DVLADFLKSCKKYGIRPGIYYNVNYNSLYQIHDNNKNDLSVRQTYNEILLKQLKEFFLGGYGKFFEIWFDGGILPNTNDGLADSIINLVKKHQSQAILFQGTLASSKNLIRWVGNEEGRAPYPMWSRADSTTNSTGGFDIADLKGNPNGAIWCPPSRISQAERILHRTEDGSGVPTDQKMYSVSMI